MTISTMLSDEAADQAAEAASEEARIEAFLAAEAPLDLYFDADLAGDAS